MQLQRSTRATLGASVAIFLWSVSALLYCWLWTLPGLQVATLTLILGGFFCFLIEPTPLTLRSLIPKRALDWVAAALLFVTQIFYIYAFRWAPPGQVDLINYLWPMMLVISQAMLQKDNLRWYHYLGLFVGFLGPALAIGSEIAWGGYRHAYLVGYGCAVGSALCWTIYCNLVRILNRTPGRIASTTRHILMAGSMSLLVQTMVIGWKWMNLWEACLLLILALAVFGISYPLWHNGLKRGHYAVIGGMAYATPLLSIAALIIGGEAHATIALMIAPFFVIAGCCLLGNNLPLVKHEN
jgi:drug/metabolite transporter (DMT)-like permease